MAVVIWWVVVALRLVLSVPRIVAALSASTGTVVAASVALVLVLGWSALLVRLASRMARGSGNARLWLAVVAGLTTCSSSVQVVTGAPLWALTEPAALVAATVLSYLPGAGVFFPRAEHRPRPGGTRTVGWDPATGDRIVEALPGRTGEGDPSP
ncbi:hypothetical protein [Curtobacterium sp. MCSS17_015]|uniref:hypothetical protein n=1 Tax=Curtobacterium sp. MCSS17_015 TaxID=2175666 RepID=UPI0011B44960|nr:hypothetical protein [Curtobacterium sp. MCSS17_015]WIB25713.1 hypothetical protein DEJ18_11720 [Curtobacterium sp. MCSS17_015]